MSHTEVVDIFAPLYKPAPYKVLKGGRSGMKSHGVAEALLRLGRSKKRRILCAREVQKSITESVHQLLRDKIAALGYENFYTVGNSEIVGNNGTQFLFAGLKTNFASLKSKEGLDIVWVEEAAKVSRDSWKVLLPTIRKEGAELWITFNPDLETDPVWTLFCAKPRPGTVVIDTNWRQNPWLSQRTLAEIRYDFTVDPESAAHVWDGGFNRRSKAVIFAGKVKEESFTPSIDFYGPYFGADFGFAQDPATLMKLWLSNDLKKIFVEYEAYGVGVELNELPELYRSVPGSQNRPTATQAKMGATVFSLQQPVIRADNSRPETISHLRGYGFNVVAADKWPGSVEDGITWLKAHEEIVVHPRCVHQLAEAKDYKFKEDPLTGDVLPIVIDKHNHCWDADRYGFEPVIKLGEVSTVVNLGQEVSITPELDELDLVSQELGF